jgi:hypothetical protein
MSHTHLTEEELASIVAPAPICSGREESALEERVAECSECSARLAREANLELEVDAVMRDWLDEAAPALPAMRRRARFGGALLVAAALLLILGGTSLQASAEGGGSVPTSAQGLDGGVMGPDSGPPR